MARHKSTIQNQRNVLKYHNEYNQRFLSGDYEELQQLLE